MPHGHRHKSETNHSIPGRGNDPRFCGLGLLDQPIHTVHRGFGGCARGPEKCYVDSRPDPLCVTRGWAHPRAARSREPFPRLLILRSSSVWMRFRRLRPGDLMIQCVWQKQGKKTYSGGPISRQRFGPPVEFLSFSRKTLLQKYNPLHPTTVIAVLGRSGP